MPVDSYSVSPAHVCGQRIRNARASFPGKLNFQFHVDFEQKGQKFTGETSAVVNTGSASCPLKDILQHNRICRAICSCQGPEHVPCYPQQGLAARLRAAASDTYKFPQACGKPSGEGSG